jgi:hypothetical protein
VTRSKLDKEVAQLQNKKKEEKKVIPSDEINAIGWNHFKPPDLESSNDVRCKDQLS